jgi:hypothetical protein
MPDHWNTYRTRFLIHAKQLTEPLSFADAAGREHHGRPGDYLVQSSSGMLRIAPREIFEDIYVLMDPLEGELNNRQPGGKLPDAFMGEKRSAAGAF